MPCLMPTLLGYPLLEGQHVTFSPDHLCRDGERPQVQLLSLPQPPWVALAASLTASQEDQIGPCSPLQLRVAVCALLPLGAFLHILLPL